VENAFVILTPRFWILEKHIPLSVKKVPIIIKTICTLHNWLRKTSDEYFQTANPDSGDFERTLAHLTNLTNYSSNHYNTSAEILRDTYAEKFMTTEATMAIEHDLILFLSIQFKGFLIIQIMYICMF